jgi:ketosteroid isomerase-like protein
MDREYTDKLLATTGSPVSNADTDPQTVLHASFDAIVRGDFDAFGESLTDDVELSVCGFGPLDGAWRGRAEVVAATRRNFAMLEGQKPEIDSIICQGDRIAVLLHENGVFKAGGQAYNVRGVQWFTFADGKIKKVDEIIAGMGKTEG